MSIAGLWRKLVRRQGLPVSDLEMKEAVESNEKAKTEFLDWLVSRLEEGGWRPYSEHEVLRKVGDSVIFISRLCHCHTADSSIEITPTDAHRLNPVAAKRIEEMVERALNPVSVSENKRIRALMGNRCAMTAKQVTDAANRNKREFLVWLLDSIEKWDGWRANRCEIIYEGKGDGIEVNQEGNIRLFKGWQCYYGMSPKAFDEPELIAKIIALVGQATAAYRNSFEAEKLNKALESQA